MNFWQWLVHVGLIQGNWNSYASGIHVDGKPMTPDEYAHALRTAINNLQYASDPTARAEFFRRLQEAGGLAASDDLSYYIDGRATADEFENLITQATERFITSITTPTLPPPTQPPPPPTTAPPTSPEPPTIPDPTPPPETTPEPPEPFDYHAQAGLLFPYLPSALLDVFASAWADTGDVSLALATMRADPIYDSFFPGNRRQDGSLRLSEGEYFSRIEGFDQAFRSFQLNPDLFRDRYGELIEGNLSGAMLAGRIGAAYEQVFSQIPQVREIYAQYAGIEFTDQAILASFIDPNIGEAILSRRISVAQVGAEAASRGFHVEQPFAERLTFAGVDQTRARQFFAEAETALPTFDALAARFHDPDPDFDLAEFAEAAVFQSAGQVRRVRRLLSAESSLFSDQLGTTRTSGSDLALTGLSAR